jgi:hypothetical protein
MAEVKIEKEDNLFLYIIIYGHLTSKKTGAISSAPEVPVNSSLSGGACTD